MYRLASESATASGGIAAAVDRRFDTLRETLSLAPLRFLGSISYGVYMFHSLVWEAWMLFFPMSPGFVLFAIVSLLTIGVAILSFRYVETLILRLAHRRSPTNREVSSPDAQVSPDTPA